MRVSYIVSTVILLSGIKTNTHVLYSDGEQMVMYCEIKIHTKLHFEELDAFGRSDGNIIPIDVEIPVDV